MNDIAHENLPQQPTALATEPRPVTIRFEADGSDYFPIWITNLLLTVITLGIYGPWAKVRREKFFHQHTKIDGTALDYHGEPLRILIGRLIAFVVFVVIYSSGINLVLALVLSVLVAAIVPLIMQRSLRFRLLNTSYRGLRFSFDGTVSQAYSIGWIPATLFIVSTVILNHFSKETDAKAIPVWTFALIALLPVLYPFIHALWRRYAINHSRYGDIKTATDIGVLRFITPYLITGLMVLGFIVLSYLVLVYGIPRSGVSKAGWFIFAGIFLALVYLAFIIYLPTVSALIHNLCWNRATYLLDADGNKVAEFQSNLNVFKYVLLQLKNFFLTVISFGFYRPFAACNTAKRKLESISISDFRFIDDVTANAANYKSAIAEEAMGLLDFDFSI